MVALEKVLAAKEQESGVDRAVWHRINGVAQADEPLLKRLIDEHHKWTGSLRARHILDHWAESRAKFVKVFPHEYKRALAELGSKGAAVQGDAQASKTAVETIAKAKSADKKSAAVAAK
jgi:glutamate synthase (NADPH/NADH) large chain